MDPNRSTVGEESDESDEEDEGDEDSFGAVSNWLLSFKLVFEIQALGH